MNRFRKNRKGKDIGDDLDSMHPALLASNPFKKTKKPDPEPKPQIDLSSVLPSTDEFRTSLLMPKLSARFSMLREQDDPNTKIGKANDDSVLFPKRASRLNLFGHSPSTLADIAEVSSLHGRPSLALGRTHSQGSGEGDGTDDDVSLNGSVMSRKRPGEGNVLFGGRQKIYKIPMSRLVAESQGLRGRTVYEDDVTLSTFQRLRLNEKEKKEKDEQLGLVTNFQDSTATEPEDTSPASRTDRTTTSSIASSNRRSSTAATSIDEQPHAASQPSSSVLGSSSTSAPPSKPSWGPPERNPTKTRRLYGQSLAQAVQEQQSSALSRLESLNRQRSGAGTREFPPRLNRTFSKSATNLNERSQKPPGSPVRGGLGQRSHSPSLSGNSPELQSTDTDNQDATSSNDASTVPLGYNHASASPSETPDAAILAMAMQPEDRGKATAMGLFNKPNSSYDDQQFTRRQLQMYGGRKTPPSRRRSPPTSISQSEAVGRPRGLSNTSYRSKAESTSSHHSSKMPNGGTNPTVLKEKDASPPRLAERSFLVNLSGSDSESDGNDFSLVKDSPAISPALDGVHPALRSHLVSTESSHAVPAQETQGTYPEFGDVNIIIENHTAKPPPSPILEEAPEKTFDSPTLGPSGLGLSGLIRTHLRRDSDRSSIFPPSPPMVPPMLSPQSYHQGVGRDAVRDSNPPASIHSNPWEYDDLVDRKNTPSEDNPSPPILQPDMSAAASSMSIRARQILGQATALRDLHHELRTEGRVRQPWQDDLVFTHKRDISTETQKEREEFANELAERRRRVQEKLKSFAETESGSSSPGTGPDFSPVKSGNTFAGLKPKSTKNLAAGGREVIPPKALKTLGFSNPAMSSSTPALVSGDPPREEEGKIPYPLGKHANSSFPHAVTGRNVSTRSPASQTGSNGAQDDSYEQTASREYSPTSLNNRQRDQSARSKSRPRHREDPRAVEESIISQYEDPSFDDRRAQRLPPSLPSSARPSVERPSVEVNDGTRNERSPPASSGKARSNSRPTAPGYIDLRPIQPISPNNIGMSPRPSPVTPYSANATPPLFEADMEHSSASVSPNPSFGSHNIPQRAPGSNNLQKRVIDKSQISEPTFVSSTSAIPTVGLPAGSRLTKLETPPVPPMNPRRRRQTTTQTIIGALKGDKHNLTPAPSGDDGMNERSTFSDDDEKKPVVRQKLRKTSSEGGNLNARIRQQARLATPAVPQLPTPAPVGGMI